MMMMMPVFIPSAGAGLQPGHRNNRSHRITDLGFRNLTGVLLIIFLSWCFLQISTLL
jgi:hypothetical protein